MDQWCPITGENCMENECAWYTGESCVIYSLAQIARKMK